MSCEHGWKEEEIIDFVMERLPTEKRNAFGRHVDNCDECKEKLSEWKNILGQESGEEPEVPAPKMKRRLMNEISPTRKRRLPALRKPMIAFMAACAMLFVVLGTDLFTSPSHTGNMQRVNGKPRISPQTGNGQVRYVPVNDQNVNGYVWVNGTTDELLLFLNGLNRINGKDYQAWLVSPGQRANAGLLKVNHGMARLYYQGPKMENARHIVVSVEPHGGSESETGPEKFFIQLGANR